jgi:hypothetical protein
VANKQKWLALMLALAVLGISGVLSSGQLCPAGVTYQNAGIYDGGSSG